MRRNPSLTRIIPVQNRATSFSSWKLFLTRLEKKSLFQNRIVPFLARRKSLKESLFQNKVCLKKKTYSRMEQYPF